MSETIDALRLNVTTDLDTKSIVSLTAALKGLQTASNGSNIGNMARQMTELSNACTKLQAVSNSLDTLISSLTSLDNIKGTGINNAAKGLQQIPYALNGIQNINIGASVRDIENLTVALLPLNNIDGSGIKNAASGLEKLPDALTGLDSVEIGNYTEKVKELSTALSPLAAVMRDIADGGKVLNSTFKLATTTTKTYGTANKTASMQVGDLGSNVTTLTRKLSSLIIKIGAAVGGFRAISNAISDGIVNSMDYIENLNLFTVSMGEYADSQRRYAETVSDIMGIDPSEWMRNEGVFNNMLEGFGIGTDDAAWMSQNLTGLLYDYASFYNLTIEQAAQKITSAISGELEPVRRQGFDLSQAALTQLAQDPKWYGSMTYSINEETGAIEGNSVAWDANSNAVIANYSDMTQAEKAQLRYIALLTQNSDMVGDFARTLEDPANQLRIFKNNMTMVSRALGNIFIPALNKVMPYLIAGAQVLKDILNTIAELMGFQLPDMSSRVSLGSDAVGGYEDVEDALGGAAGNAKKLKDYMIGIDELNVLNNNDDNGGGGSGGAGYASDLSYALPGYDFIGDATNSRVAQIKAQIEDLLNSTERDFRVWGERVGEVLNNVLVKWEDPWQTGYDIGTGISDILEFADGIVITFDWALAGKDIGKMISGFFDSDITYEIPNLALDIVRGTLSFASALVTNVNVFKVADNVMGGITEAIMKEYSDENFGGHFENGVWVMNADGDITWTLERHLKWADNHPLSTWIADQIMTLSGSTFVDREGNLNYEMPIMARLMLTHTDDPLTRQFLSYITGQDVTRESLIRVSVDVDTSIKTWIEEHMINPILEAIGTIASALGEFLHIGSLEEWGQQILNSIDGLPNSGGGGSRSNWYKPSSRTSNTNNSSTRNTDMGSYYADQASQQARQRRRGKNAEAAGLLVAESFAKGINSGRGLIVNAGISSGEAYADGANSRGTLLFAAGNNLKDTLLNGASSGLYNSMHGTGENAGKGLNDGAASWRSIIGNTGSNLKDTLVNNANGNLYNSLYYAGSNGGSGFNSGADAWRGRIGTTGTNLKNTLVSSISGNLYGLLWDAGSNGVAGFAQAFKDSPHINNLINNAKAVAQSAIDAVKGTLGVHSPSVVMKDIGEQTVQGLSNGLKDTTPTIVNQVKQTVTSVTNTATNTAKGTLTKALLIKSPSHVFEEIGAYTAEGFNVGFSEEAENTYRMMSSYAKKLSNVSVDGLYTPSNGAMPGAMNPNVASQVQANNVAAMAAMGMTMYEAMTGAMGNQNGNERDINLKVMINGREVFYAVREEERKNGYEVSNGAFGG